MMNINLQSKAFRKGFLDGFTAYYVYFRPQMYNRTRSIDPSIENTWKKVGDALRSAYVMERGELGKNPEKLPQRTSQLENDDLDEIAEEISRRISNLVPSGQRSQVVAQMVSLVKEESFSGPLPHPKHLREYEEVCPGAADRIIAMAEQGFAQAQHVQEKALDGDIQDSKAGRLYGFLALMALIVAALFATYLDHEVIAGAFLGAGALGVIGQLIQGSRSGKAA